MAQLNPNFEIDFSDINSYEQIQLINDTRLAKENLLMHRAYKEPSDDEIIRNQFSSFTFADFCPKLFSVKQQSSSSEQQQQNYPHSSTHPVPIKLSSDPCARLSLNVYELETFSDLFERINTWLKLNKDWRVVSMETLVYDCTSQFNHQKSSIYSKYLPQNTRGLRLFLSPSKSRFSGPQKIGCINVVPRKVSGSYLKPEDPPVYETLDEILNRLNELLLTRPIEGRILSVETITLPMVNGYVNTESNYFVDSRLNSLYDSTYNAASDKSPEGDGNLNQTQQRGTTNEQNLIDILRVYYEFGPLVCGLVNLIDFVPRFYSSKPSTSSDIPLDNDITDQEQNNENLLPKSVPKIATTESLTRLIRRSLGWFELERKRILNEKSGTSKGSGQVFDLKVCNLQVHHRTLLKGQLLQVTPTNAIDIANTRIMLHERMDRRAPIVCSQCSTTSANSNIQDWCSHLIELTQPYNLKFVRLAYIVPVFNNFPVRPPRSLRLRRPSKTRTKQHTVDSSTSAAEKSLIAMDQLLQDISTSSSQSSETSLPNADLQETVESSSSNDESTNQQQQVQADLLTGCEQEDSKQVALSILRGTNKRHIADEQLHQTQQIDAGPNDSFIGQLTYRLFAPCQLVASSSCFSINPVNSSSPLARRGSVDINGSGISSENAHPSTSLLAPGSNNSLSSGESQHVVTSFGAFFPALSHEVVTGISSNQSINDASGVAASSRLIGAGGTLSSGSGSNSRFTTNEFESVDAIKRRMEVYVTTNSMKVIAGETLIVHLSDALSCLSTAIEQTVVVANCGPKRSANTWVSVYVLYAAVEEPQLPVQLLAQQKMRDLSLIDEGTGNESDEKVSSKQQVADSIFDDDFKGSPSQPREAKKAASLVYEQSSLSSSVMNTVYQQSSNIGNETASTTSFGAIRVEQNPMNSSLTLYNSAYDRTVALPTPPENHLSGQSVDPADYLGADGVWIDDDLFSDKVVHMPNVDARKKRRRKAKKRNRHDDSQCSIM